MSEPTTAVAAVPAVRELNYPVIALVGAVAGVLVMAALLGLVQLFT